jgi:hypothetical protein
MYPTFKIMSFKKLVASLNLIVGKKNEVGIIKEKIDN